MTAAEAQAQVDAIASRYKLASESSDVSALAGKNPEDVAKFIADLEAQGKRRSSNVTAPQEETRQQDDSGGDDWFASVAPPPPNFAPPPAPTYSTPARSAELAAPYVAPVWQGGDFAAPGKPTALQSAFAAPELPEALRTPYADPTAEEVQNEPGYKFGLDEGILARDRSAAANGSVLSGGQQKRLSRYATDYAGTKFGEAVGRKQQTRAIASGEYNDTYGRALTTRNQQAGEYNTDVGNAFAQYQQRYQGFLDSANLGMGARQFNEGAYQNDVGNSLNQFGTQYRSYQDTISNTRNASNDYWGQQMDLARNSLTALSIAKPPVF